MKFFLDIESNNDALADDTVEELDRILQTVAHRLLHGRTEGAVLDVNGNTVGSWRLEP